MLRASLEPWLRQHLAESAGPLVAVYLFGSVARGQERPDSDIDLAVFVGKGRHLDAKDLERLSDLQIHLAGLLDREVDLVPLDLASPDFVHQVLTDGILVHESDREARLRFEIQARNEYFDLLPHLQLYRRIVLARA